MGWWKFSLQGLCFLAIFKMGVALSEDSPLVLLVILVSIAILVAFFFGGTGKDK